MGIVSVANLGGTLEYRCCKEIQDVSDKLSSGQEGQQPSQCINLHSDFSSLTNRTVLLHVY